MSDEFIAAITAKLAEGNYSAEELAAFLQELESLDEASYIRTFNELYVQVVKQAQGEIDPHFKATLEAKLDSLPLEADSQAADYTPVVGINPKRYGLRWKWTAAAAILLLLAGSIYWWQGVRSTSVPVAAATSPGTEVLPGGDRAVLTLADGRTIVLDSAKDGELASQGNTKVLKSGDGRLTYQATAGSSVAWNTISTPRGGQYQLILPDGTHVWLNAVSSLRFPTAFTGDSRQVELTGEAYFEVAPYSRAGEHGKLPFLVLAGETKVEVLGTHFNVNAYADEKALHTTLLEGSVKIIHGSAAQLLHPGQQAILDKATDALSVQPADTVQAVAWKNGYFELDNTDLPTIMRQIARWYDVNIQYQDTGATARFGGGISRKLNLSDALHLMESSGLHFRVEGRNLTVSK
jgi:ferric-dicitrate binding protein FerR (iron transport regulator)